MRACAMTAMMLALVAGPALPLLADEQAGLGRDGVVLVPTFHCIGIYWSPSEGGAGREVRVAYRRSGEQEWCVGVSLCHHPVATPECRADYRGSLVNLVPGTSYEVVLTLDGTSQRIECGASTWSEELPVESVVKVADRSNTLNVDRSGRPGAYVLYDGTGCTLDTGNEEDVGIAVSASHVILRGFTIRNVREHGIRILKIGRAHV